LQRNRRQDANTPLVIDLHSQSGIRKTVRPDENSLVVLDQ